MRVSKILAAIFGIAKTLGIIFGGQQRNCGIVESLGVPLGYFNVLLIYLKEVYQCDCENLIL